MSQPPQAAEALFQAGLAAGQRGDLSAAAALIRQATAAAPRIAAYHSALGVILLGMKAGKEAAAAFRSAIRLQPADAGAHAYLSAALAAAGDFDGAVKAAGATLRLCPGDPEVLHMRGVALEKAGQYAAALADLDAAVAARSGGYTARLSRAALLLSMGHVQKALDGFTAAIPHSGGDARARQGCILAMNYLPGASMRHIGAVARDHGPFAMPPPERVFTDVDRCPGRTLRVGYVSGDFRNHPVGYFLHSVLAARDRSQIDVTCYSNTPVEDAMTARLRAGSDRWRSIFDSNDDQAADLVRQDRIDILVDLAGHTNSNRLSLFARRAAPVQASWLGYFGTTGVPAIDYVIADRHVVPPDEEDAFSEQVIRLPDSYLCFSPPAEAGPVSPQPTGPVTFGCFNNRAKLNPDVFDVWAKVLASVPGSRLLLKSALYADKTIRREITAAFVLSGIQPERLLFEGASPIAAMFDAYGRVDIALDPFPFAGGATTAQALWMGVPVVTLSGQTWPGRQGASLLHAAGFPEWVAPDIAGYVETARRLAADRPGLAALRGRLRETIAASPLCDAGRFAANLQAAYRDMWHAWLTPRRERH